MMKISTSEKKKLIGAEVPRSIDEYLSMISIDRKVSKSELIRELLVYYIRKKERAGLDVDTLCERISDFLSNEWKMQRISNKFNKSNFEIFKKDANDLLIRKGISEQNIEKILNKISQ